MPGDYSRNTFDARRHYSGVLMQQGRVQLDADWNEQQAIQAHRAHTTAADVIGPTGAPKQGGGLRVDKNASGKDLTLSVGRFYVGGLLCELDVSATAVTYLSQPDHPLPEFFRTVGGQRELDVTAGTYLAYLDAWEQEVTALGDPRIREVALGDADTALRKRVLWQVRLARLAANPADCGAAIPEWAPLTAEPGGTLNAHTVTPPPPDSACLLPPSAGYTRLENQLYRVEIHKAGALNTATFKWSRDNATVETAIEAINGTVLSVADVGKDDVLGFAAEQWVEIVDHEAEVERSPRPLIQIASVDPAKREITLKSSAAAYAGKPKLRLRRWDQNGSAEGVTTAAGWIGLEGGIEVAFGAGSFRAGDYWLIPARTITGEIEWPPYAVPNTAPLPQKPHGTRHRYARLGLVRVGANGLVTGVDDCRARFPALTEICAEDVCYEPQACGPEFAQVETVQQALDTLCKRQGDACSFVATPGQNLQAIIDAIPAGGDASICFKAGTYTLPGTLAASGKGRLKLVGCGPGTRIVAAGSESALSFGNCKAVIVRDLYAESGTVASGNRLIGTLNFVNCERVELSAVSAKCAGGARRAASCITVRQQSTPSRSKLHAPSARIVDCDLEVGHRQTGVLLVNIANAVIEHNRIHAAPRPPELGFSRLVFDKYYRSRVRDGLIANASFGAQAPAGGITNVKVEAGGQTLHFKTHPMLKTAWARYLSEHPATNVSNGQQLLAHLIQGADAMIMDEALRVGLFKAWFDLIVGENVAAVFQGIVVAGRVAEEVRVRGNTVEDALQGIHIGVSHRVVAADPLAGRVDVAGTVAVAGNTLEVILPMEAIGDERHGIFVGNCESLAIEGNRIKLRRLQGADKLSIDGIRVHGHIGPMAAIRGNHMSGFPTGIAFTPRFPYPDKKTILWSIEENLAQEAKENQTVLVPGGAPVDRRLNRPPHRGEQV